MAFNSSIRQKTGICCDCSASGDNTIKPVTANRCNMHYRIHRGKECAAKKKTISKTIPVKDKSKLTAWFKEQRIIMPDTCENCGAPTAKYSEGYWKFSIAHIFAKSLFPSVSCHPMNRLFLCPSKCHSVFDRDIDSAGSMNCFKLAVDRFKLFENEITETHKYLELFKNKAKSLGYE